jgi:hypothetical protein
MDESHLKELIMKRQTNQRIACKTAFEIAEETGASRAEIGRLLNELNIKVHSCQLGCFR